MSVDVTEGEAAGSYIAYDDAKTKRSRPALDRFRLVQGRGDCRTAIGFNNGGCRRTCHPREDFVNDSQRIFATRVVAGHDRHVRQQRGPSEKRSLCSIPVTAGAEHAN